MIDSQQLKLLLCEKENLTLEFKEKYSPRIDEDIIAFSNIKGGIDDKIIIANPGSLAKGLTKDNFGKHSIRRNELIADLFYRMDKIEKAGTGIQRIKTQSLKAGISEPEFEFGLFFSILFKRHSYFVEQITSEKTSEKIIALIKLNPFLSAKEIGIKLEISSRAVEMQLSKLKEEKRINRIGADKGGHWVIIR
ncbi:hypothetical protein HZA96_03810 [Candidatus Woesearchaeota archaeon]|nr:hypothetical protein [Candidatus Woesearchaeota archaeon]